jgi:hypothetical protein
MDYFGRVLGAVVDVDELVDGLDAGPLVERCVEGMNAVIGGMMSEDSVLGGAGNGESVLDRFTSGVDGRPGPPGCGPINAGSQNSTSKPRMASTSAASAAMMK